MPTGQAGNETDYKKLVDEQNLMHRSLWSEYSLRNLLTNNSKFYSGIITVDPLFPCLAARVFFLNSVAVGL